MDRFARILQTTVFIVASESFYHCRSTVRKQTGGRNPPAILLKTQLAYRQAVQETKEKDISECLPSYFNNVSRKECAKMNPITEYVLDSDTFDRVSDQEDHRYHAWLLPFPEFTKDHACYRKERGLSTHFNHADMESALLDLGHEIKECVTQKAVGKMIFGLRKKAKSISVLEIF